jgi:hypothetical protein
MVRPKRNEIAVFDQQPVNYAFSVPGRMEGAP